MSEHTPGPWVGFSDQGKCTAIMPAMREGDICTFNQSPSDADATLMIAAPALLKALESIAAWADLKDPTPNENDSGEEVMYGEGYSAGLRAAGKGARALILCAVGASPKS